jgi:hypothetical protein
LKELWSEWEEQVIVGSWNGIKRTIDDVKVLGFDMIES